MKLILPVALLLLSACTPHTAQVDRDFILPKELKHCSVYNMSDGYKEVVVVHCPNSETISTANIYQQGKAKVTHNAVVIKS